MRELAPLSAVSETLTTEDRGTLALTNSGAVLGCPRDATENSREEAARRIDAWLRHGSGVLNLPFPVDVEDLR